MQIDQINAVVRPRHSWEALDLGFRLIQREGWTFYKIWLLLFVPWFLFWYVIFFQNLGIASFIVWWFKPLYDRIILHFLSMTLFGEQLTIWGMLRTLPRLLYTSRLWLGLTLWRLDIARAFNLPVWQLEGLHGAAARERRRVLSKQEYGQAVWLTFICVHFEWVLIFSMLALIYMFVPTYYEIAWESVLFSDDLGWWIEAIGTLMYFAIIGFLEPFYVAAGFALYLNRRTHLEGWDIELIFRQLAARLESPIHRQPS